MAGNQDTPLSSTSLATPPINPALVAKLQELLKQFEICKVQLQELTQACCQQAAAKTPVVAAVAPALVSSPFPFGSHAAPQALKVDKQNLFGLWNYYEGGSWSYLAMDEFSNFFYVSADGNNAKWGTWSIDASHANVVILTLALAVGGFYPAKFYGVLGQNYWSDIIGPDKLQIQISAFQTDKASFSTGGFMTRRDDVPIPLIAGWISGRVATYKEAEQRNKQAGIQASLQRDRAAKNAAAMDIYINSGVGRPHFK